VYKNNFDKYYETARLQIGFLQKYEKCNEFVEVSEGQESDEFWML
jgi:hypothetical protein